MASSYFAVSIILFSASSTSHIPTGPIYSISSCIKSLKYFPLLLILNSKIIKIRFIFILCSKTGICQISFFIIPFFQTTIVEHFKIIIDNEWYNIIFQTFLKHNQSSYTTITISSCQGWDKKKLTFFHFVRNAHFIRHSRHS